MEWKRRDRTVWALEEFIASVSAYLDDGGFQTKRSRDFRYYDIEIRPKEIPVYLEELKRYAPYGKGNPKPGVLVRGFESMPVSGRFFQCMGKLSERTDCYGRKDVQIIISDFRRAAEKKTDTFHMLERILAY